MLLGSGAAVKAKGRESRIIAIIPEPLAERESPAPAGGAASGDQRWRRQLGEERASRAWVAGRW